VLIDGRRVNSCLTFAVMYDGAQITTIECLAAKGALHPLQQAFIDHDAPQCGFCTSGQLMCAKGLLARNPRPTEADVRAGMTGNLCRCAGYNHYVEAVLAASRGGAR